MGQVDIIIGKRIRSLRNKYGWSQEELAHRAGIHTSHMGRLERGEKSTTLSSLEKILSALNVTFEDLFNYYDSDDKSNSSTIYSIVSELKKCNIDEQESVYKIIQELIRLKNKNL